MLRKFFLLVLMSLLTVSHAAAQEEGIIQQLQKQMYKYFSSQEQERFFNITDSLKAEALKAGDEQVFYRAWGNQALYYSYHQQRNSAIDLVKEMRTYANEHDSRFGEYTALHVLGSVQIQMEDYAEAEVHFLEAIELLHEFFPGESAAADLMELTTIANRRSDPVKGQQYAEQVLREPNVQPQHKIRAISMLCQYAFQENNRELFNRYYDEWSQMLNATAAGKLKSTLEVDYEIINGNLDRALELCEEVPLERRYELYSYIYHRLGDDTKAYLTLKRHKEVSDSLTKINQHSLLSDYIVQLNTERMEREQRDMADEVRSLRVLLLFTVVIAVVLVLIAFLWQRQRMVKHLRHDNKELDIARQEADSARKEAEKALDVKREFLNNISHELRTPLNPITGFSDILATPGFELDVKEREAMSQHIKESSHVLTDIIDHMIELSFYESKTSLPRNEEVSPNAICISEIDNVRHLVNPNVEISYKSALPDNVKIKTDMQSLAKVVHKLLDNAIKFTDHGSIVVSTTEQAKTVRISVTDTGCGIPKERQEHIFELFSQTDDNIKTMGLGLGICKAIVSLLEGRIWLDTDYQQGARFVVEVPK